MRTRNWIVAMALAAALPLAAFAAGDASTGKKGTVTVADFAVMLASASGGVKNLDAGKAVDALAKSGVPLGDPSAVLTDARLVEILGHYGVRARASNPAAAVSLGKAEAAVLLIDPANAGKGQTAARAGTGVQSLDDFLMQPNHGQCVGCCKDLGTTSANQCARFCMQINKPSESEPLP
jgi:hypothetical protein